MFLLFLWLALFVATVSTDGAVFVATVSTNSALFVATLPVLQYFIDFVSRTLSTDSAVFVATLLVGWLVLVYTNSLLLILLIG